MKVFKYPQFPRPRYIVPSKRRLIEDLIMEVLGSIDVCGNNKQEKTKQPFFTPPEINTLVNKLDYKA